MIPSQASTPLLRLIFRRQRQFSTSAKHHAKNRIYTSVRHPNDLHNLNLLSASSRIPLITLWSTSWCSSCQTVRPLLKELIEEEGVGEEEGGIGFAEVEMDAPEIGDLPITYKVSSMPMLLAFSRQEPQMETRLTLPKDMKDRKFMEDWIRTEARRGGAEGAGGKILGGLFSRG